MIEGSGSGSRSSSRSISLTNGYESGRPKYIKNQKSPCFTSGITKKSNSDLQTNSKLWYDTVRVLGCTCFLRVVPGPPHTAPSPSCCPHSGRGWPPPPQLPIKCKPVWRSVTFCYRSGFASHLWLSDPDSDPNPDLDPGIFVSDLQDDNLFLLDDRKIRTSD